MGRKLMRLLGGILVQSPAAESAGDPLSAWVFRLRVLKRFCRKKCSRLNLQTTCSEARFANKVLKAGSSDRVFWSAFVKKSAPCWVLKLLKTTETSQRGNARPTIAAR